MTYITNNFSIQSNMQKTNENPVFQERARISRLTPDEFFRREKRKNDGLVEKFYNWIKNISGLGVGTKKVDKVINDVKTGKASAKELQDTIHKYHNSQENSAQLVGDATSILAGGVSFFALNKQLKMWSAKLTLNKNAEEAYRALPFGKSLSEKVLPILKSNPKMMAISAGVAAITAGYTKLWTLKLNRMGSDEFKVDENIYGKKSQRNKKQKELAKQAKRKLSSERRKTNFKNFASGAINGLMTPILALGGIIGAPIYLVGNSLNRYFVGTKTDKQKSMSGYVNNLTQDIVTTGLVTTGIAIPLVKKGNFAKVFEENLSKAVKKLENAELKKPNYQGIPTYRELQNSLLHSEEIANIIHNDKISVEEQIRQLTKENIFAVKFKQIINDGSQLCKALKDDCPPTRTIEQAQQYINTNLGSGYNVSKLLGVGTVAETYLAKDSSGKDVCIKIIKEGISKEKITADKQKFINLINKLPNKTQDEKKYLVRNIEDLANGVIKEVDLQNEMNAANELAKYTNVANVVKPMKVKNNIYVMEKANGISLSSLVNLNEAKLYKEMLEKNSVLQEMYKPQQKSDLYQIIEKCKTKSEKIKAIDEYIKKIEARTPEFGNINLSKDDANYLINQYMKVLTEQFNKIEKNGKVLHADIHPGNIFIDINALRARKGKIFTLIDTGNTINQSVEQSMRAINLSSYLKHANVKDLTDYALEGAILPKGMDKNEAIQKVSEELKKCFFDNETKIQTMTNEHFMSLTSNIMRKYNIIPSDTQLNLNKARTSANNSLNNLIETLCQLSLKDVKDQKTLLKSFASLGKDALVMKMKYAKMQSAQEKLNLLKLSPAEQIKQKNNPNMLKTNSEDYLVYKLKQSIKQNSM